MIKRILNLLTSDRVIVLLEKIPEWGLCERENNTISIRKTLSRKNKAKTLIHECIHYLYPQFEEDTVLRIERDLWNQITLTEYHILLTYIGEQQ